MTAADKLRELLETRPALPNHGEVMRWWRDGGDLVAEMLGEVEGWASLGTELNHAKNALSMLRIENRQLKAHLPSSDVAVPPGPLDEMAQNLMDELHKMKFEGAPIGMGLRLDRLLDKVHALAVVTADTRIRLLAVERTP